MKEDEAIVIDSSFLVSLLVQKDINHQKALNVWRDIREKGVKIFAPALLLPEVCGAIARVTKDKNYANKVKRRIEKWLTMKVLTLKELTIKRASAAANVSIDLNIKGADAIFVSLAHELNLKFLTFDEEIKKKIKDKVKLF